MLTELQQYLLGLLKPKHPITHEVHHQPYKVCADGTLGAAVLEVPPICPPLFSVETLTGFVDAFRADIDADPFQRLAIHVSTHLTVSLVALDGDKFGRRREWLRATCQEAQPFVFGEYHAPEKFLIALHQGFLPTEAVVSLQRLASSLTTENSVSTSDDGISQKVTVSGGSVSRSIVTLPTRIPLAPYRSFRELTPCITPFMIRMKGEPGKLPSIALIELDAGKWRLDTVQSIVQWLRVELPDAVILS